MSDATPLIITGSNGQLGRSLRDVSMPGHYQPHYFTRSELDITDADAIEEAIVRTGCRYFINCAAYTKVDLAETEQESATAVNVGAVAAMAQASARHDVTLIHISTDYVYDQDLGRPFREDDPVNPQSVYARTKLAGEQAALQHQPRTVILRTSWVFSDYGHNFVKTMLRLAADGRSLKVVADQVGCPTYARDLAQAILRVMQTLETGRDDVFGVYNFSNAEPTNWHDFAAEIFRQAGMNADLSPTTSDAYVTPARRPAYSVMDTSRFRRTFGMTPRSWQEALAECLPQVIPA
ncbi:MAG: dTDP-4-dehydrorhamnose reductase [Saprospiraceae bacterium]|nr:dTDP-4-dehydrorhamnose reductase [Saprospiraceae bacterium]